MAQRNKPTCIMRQQSRMVTSRGNSTCLEDGTMLKLASSILVIFYSDKIYKNEELA